MICVRIEFKWVKLKQSWPALLSKKNIKWIATCAHTQTNTHSQKHTQTHTNTHMAKPTKTVKNRIPNPNQTKVDA